MEFHYVDLRVFCYATEDEDRVLGALETFLPPDTEEEVERSVTEGHYGDEIVVFDVRFERADEIRHVMNRVLESEDVEGLRGEIEDRVDPNCAFHLRFDKQAAYNGEVKYGDGITLRAKVEAYPAKHEKAVKAVKRSLFKDG